MQRWSFEINKIDGRKVMRFINDTNLWWAPVLDEAYQAGRESVIAEFDHDQKKLLDGFAHPKDCGKCKEPK